MNEYICTYKHIHAYKYVYTQVYMDTYVYICSHASMCICICINSSFFLLNFCMYVERKTNGTTQKTEAFEVLTFLVIFLSLLCSFYYDNFQNFLNLQFLFLIQSNNYFVEVLYISYSPESFLHFVFHIQVTFPSDCFLGSHSRSKSLVFLYFGWRIDFKRLFLFGTF